MSAAAWWALAVGGALGALLAAAVRRVHRRWRIVVVVESDHDVTTGSAEDPHGQSDMS